MELPLWRYKIWPALLLPLLLPLLVVLPAPAAHAAPAAFLGGSRASVELRIYDNNHTALFPGEVAPRTLALGHAQLRVGTHRFEVASRPITPGLPALTYFLRITDMSGARARLDANAGRPRIWELPPAATGLTTERVARAMELGVRSYDFRRHNCNHVILGLMERLGLGSGETEAALRAAIAPYEAMRGLAGEGGTLLPPAVQPFMEAVEFDGTQPVRVRAPPGRTFRGLVEGRLVPELPVPPYADSSAFAGIPHRTTRILGVCLGSSCAAAVQGQGDTALGSGDVGSTALTA
jgi:hypothetical protein